VVFKAKAGRIRDQGQDQRFRGQGRGQWSLWWRIVKYGLHKRCAIHRFMTATTVAIFLWMQCMWKI